MKAFHLLLCSIAALFLAPSSWAQTPVAVPVPVSPISVRHDYARTPDICYPVLETTPDSWPQVLGAAVARNRVALLVENYEALQSECGYADRLAKLAEQGLAGPPVDDAELIPDWMDYQLATAEIMETLARPCWEIGGNGYQGQGSRWVAVT